MGGSDVGIIEGRYLYTETASYRLKYRLFFPFIYLSFSLVHVFFSSPHLLKANYEDFIQSQREARGGLIKSYPLGRNLSTQCHYLRHVGLAILA